MNDNGHLGSTAVAELHAKRWTEDRPFFTLNEKPRRGALHAWWLRRPGCAGLEQHCSRLTPVWHGCAQEELTRKDLEQPAEPISKAVSSILAKFPPASDSSCQYPRDSECVS
jgi:hypothetical protein